MRFLAVLMLFWSCGTQERVIPLSHVRTRAAPRECQGAPEPTGIQQRGREIAREIGALRGWDLDRGIAYETASISRIREAMAADMRDQASTVVVRDQTRFLESFGWVPRDFNPEDEILAAFAPDVVGLYSLTWRRILLSKTAQSTVMESVLRHELVHAFQDVYFGLRERVRWAANRGDEIAAIHALSEGEAVCIVRQLEDPERLGCWRIAEGSDEDRVFDGRAVELPLAIRYGLFAPYADGIRFVKRLLRQGGWSQVDEAWRSGVHSTGELFRNADRESSREDLPAIAPPMSECRGNFIDILGEQGLASILFNGAHAEVARELASVLLTDRAAYWRCGDSCLGVWHIRTRTTDGAHALTRALRKALGIAATADSNGHYCATSANGTRGLSNQLHDIVITSMHNCDPSAFEIATSSCALVSDWAQRLIADARQRPSKVR